MAAIKLKFVVEELTNVLTEYDQIKVYRSTTGEGGAYSEITGPGTRVDLVAGQTLYEYIDAAGDPDYWYKFSYFNSVTLAEGSLSDPISGQDSGGYCSLQDLRDEGITSTRLSDADALVKIEKWSRWFDRMTNRWFEPRQLTLILDGDGGTAQRVGHPIIKVDSVDIVSGRGDDYDEDPINVDDLLIYNRHLTQGLTRPDDRDLPLIEVPRLDQPWRATGVPDTVWAGIWRFPQGRQNIKVTGIFGYTELPSTVTPGETSPGSQIPNHYGETPPPVRDAIIMLIVRDLIPIASISRREDYRKRWRLESEKTRDQSYKLGALQNSGGAGAWTGDPDIDSIIAMYTATLSMAEAV